jgi:hypothetical protein
VKLHSFGLAHEIGETGVVVAEKRRKTAKLMANGNILVGTNGNQE